jgi:hypothetical protein
MTVRLDLSAARNASGPGTIWLYYRGDPLPLTGANAALQVRLYPGAAGDPLIDKPIVSFDDSAAETTAEPDRRLLRLRPAFAPADFDGLPSGLNAPEAGEADRYAWDILLTYSDGAVDRLAYGDFLLAPGVTNG